MVTLWASVLSSLLFIVLFIIHFHCHVNVLSILSCLFTVYVAIKMYSLNGLALFVIERLGQCLQKLKMLKMLENARNARKMLEMLEKC